MSGVYARNRHLSAQKYFALALEIRAEITKKVTTKQLPKSYRFVFAVPMAETARSLVMNLVKADAFYPNTARNIDHEACKRLIDRALDDDLVKAVVFDQIDAHGTRGLGLGSEPNQVLAVALSSPIDHLMLSTPGILASGRYMDDSYCIALEKTVLHNALKRIESLCDGLGIVINRKKTRIVKLSRGFVFLKKRFYFGDGGKVVVRPCRSSITRQRRKLKKQAALVGRGMMTKEQVNQSYQSWRGGMKRLDAHDTVLRMDALYKELFG